MTARKIQIPALILMTMLCVHVAGCGDQPVAPGDGSLKDVGVRDLPHPGHQPRQGTVVVNNLPGDVEASWTLSGPDGFSLTGQGKQVVPDAEPGEYSVAWSEVAGWNPPAASSGVLVASESLEFSGEYLAIPAATPDEAVQLFRDTYEGRHFARYRALLADDFLFVDQDGGLDDQAQEIVIADRMFHEIAGDNGAVIADITIDLLQPQGVWTATPANDPIFGGHSGSLYRPYVVDIKFLIAGQSLYYRAQGPVLLYVEDVGEQDVRILGIVDLTYGEKATETRSWSSVRGLFD